MELFNTLLPFIMLLFGAILFAVWYFIIVPRTSIYMVIRPTIIDGIMVNTIEYLDYKQMKEQGKQLTETKENVL